jgi:hypothetical protein
MPALRMGSPQVMTVLGPVHPGQLGIADAHNPLWIDVVQGSAAGSPVLNSYGPILAELKELGREGGTTVLDCQPGGCGRNVSRLADLSRDSGGWIVACTGFHRRRYYPMDYWLWRAPADQAAQHLVDEATRGLEEARERPEPVSLWHHQDRLRVHRPGAPAGASTGGGRGSGEHGAGLGGPHGERRGRRGHCHLPHRPGGPAYAACFLPYG